ncbi:MAG: TldD/PmbA family protein [Deltaproteobacteria bacterium]|nr:TldD/PmbA family protein [Deltaproteobacteria bacterium]
MLGRPIDSARVLRAALSNGGDWAELFLEERQLTTVFIDHGRVESVDQGSDAGAGVRLVRADQTSYGASNALDTDNLVTIAGGLAVAVEAPTEVRAATVPETAAPSYKPDEALAERVELCSEIEAYARGIDLRIAQISVAYAEQQRRIAVVDSAGLWREELQLSIKLTVFATARDDDDLQLGQSLFARRASFDRQTLRRYGMQAATDAVRIACLNLDAPAAPRGAMPVVIAGVAGGTMVHEAVGHGLEGDLVEAGFSVYRDQLGQRIASEQVTLVDDATLVGLRGSFGIDDEGQLAERTVLIENGVLKGFMHNRTTAARAGVKTTGNGRRESYKHRPLVRMSNTVLQPGDLEPARVLAPVSRGLYVKQLGAGEVDTVSGDFVFEVTEGYLIENGQVGHAVRGATLCGNGPEVLHKIEAIGNDLGFDPGTCGKDDQLVPITSAQPTLRISELIVGGV